MISLSRPRVKLYYEFLIDGAKFLLGHVLNVESSLEASSPLDTSPIRIVCLQ
jgi:hypothetical protein